MGISDPGQLDGPLGGVLYVEYMEPLFNFCLNSLQKWDMGRGTPLEEWSQEGD